MSGARRSSVPAMVCGAARSSTLRSAASTVADAGSRATSAPPTCPLTPVTRMRITPAQSAATYRPAPRASGPPCRAPTGSDPRCPNQCRAPDRSSAAPIRRPDYRARRICRRNPRSRRARKSMRETARHKELAAVLVVEIDSDMLAEGRAADAHIDGDIAHRAAQHGHELSLRLGMLKMQAAQRAAHRARQVVLHERLRDTDVGVTLHLKRLRQRSRARRQIFLAR